MKTLIQLSKRAKFMVLFAMLLVVNNSYSLSVTITNSGTKTYESLFSGAITTSTASTSVTGPASGGSATNFNIAAAGDILYAATASTASTWQRIGVISSVNSASSITLVSNGAAAITSGVWMVMPRGSSSITNESGDLTISFANTMPVDSMILSLTFGRSSGSASGTLTLNNSNLTIIPTSVTITAGTLNNITITAGKIAFRETVGNTPPTNCTYTFSASATVILYPHTRSTGSVNWTGGTFPNLTIVKSSRVYNFTSNVTINGTLTIPAGDTIFLGTNSLTLANTSTLSNSGVIDLRATATTPITDSRSTNLNVFGGRILYNSGTGTSQNILSGSYTDLEIMNAAATAATHTATGNISVSGTLEIRSNSILAMTSNTLTMGASSTLSNAGSITYTSGSGSTSFNNLTVSGTQTMSSAISVSGTLTVSSGATLDMGSNIITLGNGSTISNSGTIKTTAATPFTDNRASGSKNFNGTIEYYGTGNQTVSDGNYVNLTCSNSSGSSVNRTLNGNLTVSGTLTVGSNVKVVLNGKNMSAVNAFSFGSSTTSSLVGDANARINVTGSTAGTIYFDQSTPLTSNRLKYLGLGSSAKVTLGNTLVVYGDTSYSGVVDLRSGSVLTTNTTATDAARLVFKYNITDDRHGNIGYNGGSISGEAMVEDYFPAATVRGYRQLGHTLDSSMSLNQLTDDVDLYGTMGSGIASGRGVSGNRDGLIAATATAKNSIFLYDEKSSSGSKWIPFTTSSSTNNVIPFAAGAMYVMRPAGTGEAGSYNAQLIDYEGQLVFGSKSVTCKKLTSGNYGYNLLANPYQTCLDFDKFLTTNDAKLTSKGFKKYDKETKNYTDHVKNGSGWQRGSTAITKPNLHPGDAFWVQVQNDGDVLSFTEAMTTNDPQSDVSKGNKMEVDSTLYNTLLMKLSSSQDSTIGDEIVLLNASWGKSLSFSNGDMYNANGTCIDLSVEGGDQEKISFKTLPIANDCIIPCFVTACASGAYTFNFDINYNKPVEAITYRLLDKFTGKQQDIKSGDNYKFNIDLNDSRSFGSGRFYINCIANTLNNENIDKATSEYSIYPNPISKNGALTIARNSGSSKVGTVTLVNQLGQAIYKNQITNDMGLDILDLSGLEIQPGIYFLQLTGTNGTETIKLVIK